MSVRNIRAHQSRGLLRPPEVRARTGYYDAEHIARIRAIQELQAEGFNLEAIRHLLEVDGSAGPRRQEFQRALLAPFYLEAPRVVGDVELERALGVLDEEALEAAEREGLLQRVGEDAWEVSSPTLLRAAGELVEMGIPVARVIEVGTRVQAAVRGIAGEFVALYRDEVLSPMLAADGRLDERGLREAQEAVERLRPLAGEAVLAAFARTMTEEIRRELERSA